MTANLPTSGSGSSRASRETRIDVVRRLMAAVELNASDEYVSYFTDDAVYKVGNAEAVVGPECIRRLAASVIHLIEKVSHDVKNIWELGDTLICEMELRYLRKDGKTVTVPNLTIVRFEGERVRSYQAFLDASSVFS
jgi:ketosteroid isomerase-like protein